MMTATTLNPTNTRPAYQDAVARFSIRDAMAGLRGDLETGLNACVECCDRHTGTGRVALRCARWHGANLSTCTMALSRPTQPP